MNSLILFDIDGTLTDKQKSIKDDMIGLLYRLKNKDNIDIGIIDGNDYKKQKEQLGSDTIKLFKWIFSENGLASYNDNKLINNENIVDKIGNDSFTHLMNICLSCLSKSESTCKRGNFIEVRNGIINISPIGKSCNQKERENFFEKDKLYGYRKNLIESIQRRWNEFIYESENKEIELQFSLGGMISIDIFPKGWDKTYCLNFVDDKYDKIYFLGNNTEKGGNDYEIFNDPRTESYSVKSPEETMKIINDRFLDKSVFELNQHIE